MTVNLAPHEIRIWSHPSVKVTFEASDSTVIKSTCEVVLTNMNIHIVSPPVTYTVTNKGDRTFTGSSVPLRFAKPHRFIQPWFGPYKWETMLSGTAPGSLIEPQDATWKLILTFIEGGAFEFRSEFLNAFGKLNQAAESGVAEVLPPYSRY